MTPSRSLAGEWTGVYDYTGSQDEAVPFTASLFDVGGVIWGVTQEPNTFAPGGSGDLHAAINGQRSGQEVQFRKEYDDVPGHDLPIRYVGRISASGDRVEGTWGIPAAGIENGGPFVMTLKPAETVTIERRRRAAAVVDV